MLAEDSFYPNVERQLEHKLGGKGQEVILSLSRELASVFMDLMCSQLRGRTFAGLFSWAVEL